MGMGRKNVVLTGKVRESGSDEDRLQQGQKGEWEPHRYLGKECFRQTKGQVYTLERVHLAYWRNREPVQWEQK